MSILPLTVPPKRLAQTISSTQMTLKLNNIQGWGGVDLTPGDFGTEAYAVLINPSRTQIEIIKIDPATIADDSITITLRGLGYTGGDTPDPSRQFPWTSNDTIVQLGTDAPQLFRDFMSQSNPQTVTAQHTYDVLPESAEVPTDDDDFVNKKYVDDKTGSALAVPVTQVAHGFVVGDLVYVSGTNTYAKAQADDIATSEVVGIVNIVTDADNFSYTTEGIVSVGVPNLPAGTVLFLSPDNAGELTDVEPTTVGHVNYPLAVITEPDETMVFHKFRPLVINTISGNPIASETIAGIVEEATQQEVDDGEEVGATGARLFVNPSKLSAQALTLKVPAGENLDPGDVVYLDRDPSITQNVPLANVSGAVGFGSAERGQVFLTPNDAALYELRQVTFPIRNFAGTAQSGNITLSIRAVTGSGPSALPATGPAIHFEVYPESLTGNQNKDTTHVFLKPIPLLPNTQYAFTFLATNTNFQFRYTDNVPSQYPDGRTATFSVGNWVLDNAGNRSTPFNMVYATEEILAFKAGATSQYQINTYFGTVKSAALLGDQVTVNVLGVADVPGVIFRNEYFISDTPGDISTTPGTINRKVGFAVADDKLLLT